MSNTSVSPDQINHLESKLLFAYGLVLFGVLLTLSLFSAFHFTTSIEKDERRLALLTGEILHTAIEQTNFSGKYHTRLFIKKIAKTYPDITSIKIVNLEGKVIAHSNDKLNNTLIDDQLLSKAKPVFDEKKPYLIDSGKDALINVINVYLPFHTGYEKKVSGIIHIAISRESSEKSKETGLIVLISLLSILTLLGLFILKQISRYLSEPLISMAKVLDGLLEHIPMLVLVQNRKGQQLYESKQFKYYFSDNKEGPASFIKDIFQSFKLSRGHQVIKNNQEFHHLGENIDFSAIHFPILVDRKGNVETICCIAEDVTNKIATEKQLVTRERQLTQVLKGASLGYWNWNYQTGEHTVDCIWMDILGLSENDLTNNIADWDRLIHQEDKVRVLPIIEQAIIDKKTYVIEFRMQHKNGDWVWIQGSGAVVEWDNNGDPLRLSGTHQNINQRKQDEKDLLFLANYDALTHLPNRNLLFEELKPLLSHRRNRPPHIALMFIDVDNFKNINDNYGHKFGDLFLLAVANKFKEAIRSNDILGRFGGDEFVLIVDDVEELDFLSTIASKILDKFKAPIILEDNVIYASVSIGISVYPHDGITFDDLLKHADAAMYKAKDAGKNCFCFFTDEMNNEMQNHQEIASKLRDAIENNLFELVYQPQVDTKTGGIKSCEALLRWHDADKGFISPAIFIPIAEKSNLILSIDEWVMEHVCRQRFKWNTMGIKDFRIDINLSGRQFSETGLLVKIERLFNDYHLAPADIGFELTEGVLIDDDKQDLSIVHELRKLGCDIALDDFGTGYSSLSYLKRFPISSLKIDRSFIVDAPLSPDGAALVNAIIAMADALGLSVLAEGVETEAQYQFIKDTTCKTIQGYYFYKPMPASEIESLLSKD